MSQRPQEGNQVILVLVTQVQCMDVRIEFQRVIEIAPAVVQALAHDGIRVAGRPSAVTALDMEHADTIVAFACKLPDARKRHADIIEWNDVPSPGENLEAARADIRRRVSQLLDTIQSQWSIGTTR